MIDSFRKKYFFLSNFYEVPVVFEGIMYGSSEAAFQAQKCKDEKQRILFAYLNPSEAKERGRTIQLREDWEDIKFQTMYSVVYNKFDQNPELAKRLLETGAEELVEGNTWGDKIWGKVDGEGLNLLGLILMDVREKLRVKK